jgi:hypothetical protein
MDKKTLNATLASWQVLNDALRTADEATASQLLEGEKTGACRRTHLLRIHGTLNRRRAERERLQLVALAAKR